MDKYNQVDERLIELLEEIYDATPSKIQNKMQHITGYRTPRNRDTHKKNKRRRGDRYDVEQER